MERTQERCFERWPGQRVWRHQKPTFSNCTEQDLGFCRGTVLAVGIYSRHIKECLVVWDSAIKLLWSKELVKYYPTVVFDDQIEDYARITRVFDYGLQTSFEHKILLAGGLLADSGRYFDEPQSQSLKDDLPALANFEKAVEQYPEMTYWRV